MGLGDTHEDLPFGHATTPNVHLRRLFAVVEGTCARLLSTWTGVPSASLDDRDLGFPLFALSRLGIYDEEVFQTASGLLAAKLGEDPPLPTQGLRQWLLACNSLNHSLAEFSESIAGYTPSESWVKEEDSRLHQMAGALAHLSTPDPLLSNVIGEVIDRPPSHLQGSKAVALYGLKVVDLLSKAGCLQSDAQLPPEHSRVLDQALEQKSKVVRRASHLENVLGNALSRCGFEPYQDVVVSPGLSADFQCTVNGNSFFVEVEGPSHFCVRPFWRPRGRAVLKQRVFASQGWPLLSVPYWIAAPPGAYIRRGLPGRPPSLEVSEKELKDLVREQLDVWHSSCKEHQVRQWWAADRVEKVDMVHAFLVIKVSASRCGGLGDVAGCWGQLGLSSFKGIGVQQASTGDSLTQKLDARDWFGDPAEAAALELLFRRPVPPAGPAVAV